MQSSFLVLGSFFVGALPFSFWIARLVAGRDLRRLGSGNPGATNLLRVAGIAPATAALVLDVAKGALPVIAAAALDETALVMGLTAVGAVLGHVLSPFLSLRGGKGVATAAGALAVLSPLATLYGLAAFVVMIAWKRYVSLASVVAAAMIGVVALVGLALGGTSRDPVLATVSISLIVIVKHVPNVKRLASGQEPRLGEKVIQS